MFGKKSKLHSGYTISAPSNDRAIQFYRNSALNRILYGDNFQVDEEKVIQYENICEIYRKNFIEMGWLRLHMPLYVHQEHLGTDFLYVPPKERNRILKMLNGGVLITLERFKSFQVAESGERFSIDELIGTGELVDISEIGRNNREKIEKGIISEEELKRQTREISETKFYFIMGFGVEGMFIYKNHPA